MTAPVLHQPAPAAPPAEAPDRAGRFRRRRLLLCPPRYFDVTYAINPWMDPSVPVDRTRAQAQWETLVAAYRAHGHTVELLAPEPGLPDLVFAANGGLVIDGRVLGVRFRYDERGDEPEHFRSWFASHGFTDIAMPTEVNEGEGDFLFAGGAILGGHGFRSTLAAHDEVAHFFGVPVVSLELTDPRFYHLDTALAVLDEGDADGRGARIAYYPGAFSPASVRVLQQRFPDAIVATERDATAFGLNAVSDGLHVFLAAGAHDLIDELTRQGFTPVPIDISELIKAGGGVKCCTLELRAPRSAPADGQDHVAHNYHPLPVTLVAGEGSWVTAGDGSRYLDLLAGYSALNFGHRHPRLLGAATAQLDRLTLTSRAFGNDQLGPFCADLAALCRKDTVLTMNTGAEAVETAIKTVRRWGYEVKGVDPDRANIIVFDGNFHGRTTTIIGFSSDPDAQRGFGPFTPGFRRVPYGDASAVAAAIDDDTVAVLVEPIQGEAGVIVPPDGYLRELRDLCTRRSVLLVADEIQAGLGRTGATFACDHEGVRPDLYILGKALGGGIVPISAVVGDREVMDVFSPGSHGSTFGGNPLACAIGREVLALLATGELQARAAQLGIHLHERLQALADRGSTIVGVRGRGLWAGIDFAPSVPSGRAVCEALLERRVLVKDTHGTTIRLAPPLTIEADDLDWGLDQLDLVMRSFASG